MGTQVLLKDKINNKILGKTLIKLGLKKYNPNVSEEYFYFKVYKRQGIVIEIGSQPETIDLPPELISDYILKNSIKIQSKNSFYINGIPETFDFGISTIFNPENNYCDKDEIVDSIEKMLLEYKIIDRDEIYTKSGSRRAKHKIHEANISDIIEAVENDEGEEWNDNSFELALIKHFIKFIIDKYKEELSLSKNNSKNKTEKEEVKELNIEKLNSIIRKCEDKIIEIKDIIKDFDYSDKKTYEELTSKVESDLKEFENIKNVNKINKIIDEINKIYRNAYNKKNNVSSLSYIMETDENIDLIKKIDIENLE